jgi:hypothetical protein
MGLKIMVLAKQCKNKLFEKEHNPLYKFYMLKTILQLNMKHKFMRCNEKKVMEPFIVHIYGTTCDIYCCGLCRGPPK